MLDRNYIEEKLSSLNFECFEKAGLEKRKFGELLERAGLDVSGRPLSTDPDDENQAQTFWDFIEFVTSIDDPEVLFSVVNRLENEDIHSVIERTFLLDYVQNSTLLHSLRELREIIESLVTHQEQNRESLIAKGYPGSSFSGCLWHNRLLSHLYHLSLSPKNERFFKKLNYPKEEVAQSLSSKEIKRLNLIRPKVFDLKLRILRHLGQLSKGESQGLLESSLLFIDNALTPEEIQFLLCLDQLYSGPCRITLQVIDEKTPDVLKVSWMPRPGGLTDILFAVGHYQKEHTIGRLAQISYALDTRNTLSWRLPYLGYLGTTSDVDPKSHRFVGMVNTRKLQPGLMLQSIRTAIEIEGTLSRHTVDKALDTFRRLSEEEKVFWRNFRQRCNAFLERQSLERKILKQYDQFLLSRISTELELSEADAHAHAHASETDRELSKTVPRATQKHPGGRPKEAEQRRKVLLEALNQEGVETCKQARVKIKTIHFRKTVLYPKLMDGDVPLPKSENYKVFENWEELAEEEVDVENEITNLLRKDIDWFRTNNKLE